MRTLTAAAAVAAWALFGPAQADEPMHLVPAYAGATAAAQAATETAVFAGGCFWGVQGVFQHVKGVSNAVSGYAGGGAKTAIYEIVGSGLTGHAESVQVSFDPRQVSYAKLLQVYFSVAHDPTQLDRQGPDSGSQYRSTIFAQTPEQARIAKDYIAQLERGQAYHAKIATTIETGRVFYPAEAYHQDFLTRHPNHGYIVINDLPKVDALKRLFPDLYRADPVASTSSLKSRRSNVSPSSRCAQALSSTIFSCPILYASACAGVPM